MRAVRVLLVVGLLSVCAQALAEPKVTVTSTVERDGITITVYNPAVSLIQERRTLSLNQGLNEFRVTWAGVTVQRESVRLDPSDPATVTVRDAVMPQNDPNTVIWHLEAKQASSQPVSISYYAGGFSWFADYVMTVDQDEKQLWLTAWANVTNSSGENYPEAKIRLVMGDVRIVSPAKMTARAPAGYGGYGAYGGVAGAQPTTADMAESAAPFSREGFAEYSFYTLERPETLDSGDTKRATLAASAAIPVRKVYTFDPNRFGGNVAMQYWFDNKKESGLGPIPPGLVRAYRQEKDGLLTLLGEDMLSYVPVDETAKVYLGNARNVLVETAKVDYQRSEEQWSANKERLISYLEETEYKVTITNRKAEEIELIVRQYVPTDAKLVKSDPDPKQPQLGTLEWTLKIGAGKTKDLTYRFSRKVYQQ